MTLKVGDSIPVDQPEGLELGAGKALEAPERRARAVVFFFVWVLPCVFIYLVFFDFWEVAAALVLIQAALVSREGRWRRGLVALALCPLVTVPALNFGEGVLDYARGTACKRIHGLQENRGDLDRWTRTYPESSGCFVLRYQRRFSSAPYNAAVGFMVRAFGALRGHHDGVYPSDEAAFAALEGGRSEVWNLRSAVSIHRRDGAFAAWLSGRLGVPELATPRPSEVREAFEMTRCDHSPGSMSRWRVRIVERDGVVIVGDESLAFLVSRRSRELFAILRRRACDWP